MNGILSNRMTRQKGSAMVEFALMSVVLILLSLGTLDFGRALYSGITAANAAGTAASYGAKDTIAAGDFEELEHRARLDAVNVTEMEATAGQVCQCPNGTQVVCSNLANVECAGYGAPRAYVLVEARQDFQSLRIFPGIPESTRITGRTWMRVR
jgi:Flp pilus assembly protein TadG